jgi:hypothetical protein
MKFCIIIPDRNDRQELTNFCFDQIMRMSIQPDKIYHINHHPQSERFDLISRVRQGFNMAEADGIDWCFIIENDDYYPANYFERFLPFFESHDFIGQDTTTYYNLTQKAYKPMSHNYHSSLFCTAFRVSALNLFKWPASTTPFLDIDLWKYARFKRRMFIKTGAVGIKHGIGLCGGNGHKMKMPVQDKDLSWLRENTDELGFQFYKGMVQKLKVTV